MLRKSFLNNQHKIIPCFLSSHNLSHSNQNNSFASHSTFAYVISTHIICFKYTHATWLPLIIYAIRLHINNEKLNFEANELAYYYDVLLSNQAHPKHIYLLHMNATQQEKATTLHALIIERAVIHMQLTVGCGQQFVFFFFQFWFLSGIIILCNRTLCAMRARNCALAILHTLIHSPIAKRGKMK